MTTQQKALIAALLTATAALPAGVARANGVGSDIQHFNPTSDGLVFVTVQSSQTLLPGLLVIGGFVDYAGNTLPPFYDPNTGAKSTVTNRLLSTDFHMGLGLTQAWDLGFSLSSAMQQTIDTSSFKPFLESTGVTDFRANTKYRLTGDTRGGVAFNFTFDVPLLNNDPFYGGVNSPIMDFELVADKVYGDWTLGVNAGYRLRNPGTKTFPVPYPIVQSQVIASAAAAYKIPKSDWNAIGEVFSTIATQGSVANTAADLTAVEGLLGLKYKGIKNFHVHGGLTTSIVRGLASPDWRGYVGVNWYPTRLFGGAPKAEASPLPLPSPEPTEEPKPLPTREPMPAKGPLLPAPEPSPSPVPAPEKVESTAKDTSVFDKEPVAQHETFTVREVNFETASDFVPTTFYPYLEKLAEYLKKGADSGHGLKQLTIYGHTDSVGSATYNQDLSQRRADSVKKELVHRYGVPADKIRTIGMGLSKPTDTNATEEGRSRNRRVEFDIERESGERSSSEPSAAMEPGAEGRAPSSLFYDRYRTRH